MNWREGPRTHQHYDHPCRCGRTKLWAPASIRSGIKRDVANALNWGNLRLITSELAKCQVASLRHARRKASDRKVRNQPKRSGRLNAPQAERPRNDMKQQAPLDKHDTHPVTQRDSDKAQNQTSSPVRSSSHTNRIGTGHPRSNSCTGIRPTRVCAPGAGHADCETEPRTLAPTSDRKDCRANNQQAEQSPDLLNFTRRRGPESPSQPERQEDRGPTAQGNRPTCNEME